VTPFIKSKLVSKEARNVWDMEAAFSEPPISSAVEYIGPFERHEA